MFRLLIKEAEKLYKSLIQQRKQNAAKIFSAGEEDLSTLNDQDFLNKAKQELNRIKTLGSTTQQLKANDEEAIAKDLANRIADAKKQFSKKNKFLIGLST